MDNHLGVSPPSLRREGSHMEPGRERGPSKRNSCAGSESGLGLSPWEGKKEEWCRSALPLCSSQAGICVVYCGPLTVGGSQGKKRISGDSGQVILCC